MAGTSKRRLGMRRLAGAGLMLLLILNISAEGGRAGEIPDADETRYRRSMALAIRIAQAEGNEGKVRKYKSLARQHRSRKTHMPVPNSR